MHFYICTNGSDNETKKCDAVAYREAEKLANENPVAGTNQLRKNSLVAVTFLLVSAAAPMTVVAGGVPMGMLMATGAGIPHGFIF